MTDRLTGYGLMVGGGIAAACVLYLMLLVLGKAGSSWEHLNHNERVQILSNISLMSRVLMVTGWIAVISLVIRLHREETVGLLLSITGAALYLGLPVAFTAYIINGSGNPVHANTLNALRALGVACLIPGLIMIVRDVILRITGGFSRTKGKTRVRHPEKNAYWLLCWSCWGTPTCKESLRRSCEVFQKGRSCWKARKGCMCGGGAVIAGNAARKPQGTNLTGDVEDKVSDREPVPVKSQLKIGPFKPPCKQCEIYAEHQRRKFMLLNPMVFVIVGALLYSVYGNLAGYVTIAVARMDKVAGFIAFRPHGLEHSVANDIHIITILTAASLAIMALSYGLKLVEYLVFDLQI